MNSGLPSLPVSQPHVNGGDMINVLDVLVHDIICAMLHLDNGCKGGWGSRRAGHDSQRECERRPCSVRICSSPGA